MSTTSLRTRVPGRRYLSRLLRRRPASASAAPDGPQLACRAPFTSLHVDQFGDARPCCQSSRVLGNVAEQTLQEIWTGPALAELRSAIEDDDLSLGCEHCAWAGRGGRETTYAVRFDRDRLPEPDAGPTRLELAPSNACNLQCTMCNGDWSSSIRLHREGRPALPRLFGARQLEEVAELAGGLDQLHLFGGEPLLMPEGLRLLDIAEGSGSRAIITTNGSVFTPRVAALLDRPGIDLVVSVDGTSPEVYESIRCGASWSALEEHLDSFIEIAKRHGNSVDLAHCLMTSNWDEFPRHLAWAAGRGLGVYVNDVLSPIELSLHHLTPPELAEVVASLRASEPQVRTLGAPWTDTWDQALARLEQTLADGAGGGRHQHLGQLSATTTTDPGGGTDAQATDLGAHDVAARLREQCQSAQVSVELELDEHLKVARVRAVGSHERFSLVAPNAVVGRRSADVRSLLERPDPPDARTVLRWDLAEASEERRYGEGPTALAERRTFQRADGRLLLRFEYWAPITEADEHAALAAIAQDGAIVELVLDGSGALTAIGPEALAHHFGLRTELGRAIAGPSDVLIEERAVPPPTYRADEVEPGLVAVVLDWPDGHTLVALAHTGSDGTQVRVAIPAKAVTAAASAV